MNDTMSEALAHLRQLIGAGAEYPDALWSTTVAFELTRFPRVIEELECRYLET